MHALAVTWTMDAARAEEHQRELREHIVPTVRQTPDFFSGYWTYNLATGKSYVFIILESEDAAAQLLDFIRRDNARQRHSGFHLDEIGLAEVVATA